jgi:acetyl-CoA carboxylase biotin carboxyl carrier protein
MLNGWTISWHAKGGQVAEGNSNTPGPFDINTVKALIALMSRHNINEVDLRNGDCRIRLLRGVPTGLTSIAAPPLPMALPPQLAAAAAVAAAAAPPAPAGSAKPLFEIKSPTPGTFYAAPNPNAEPYVKVGSRVTPEAIVCQIEAMKLFTEIQAEVSGVIAEILVQNQQPVEYGTVLFRVDTSG